MALPIKFLIGFTITGLLIACLEFLFMSLQPIILSDFISNIFLIGNISVAICFIGIVISSALILWFLK
jgi:hypothetical protein